MDQQILKYKMKNQTQSTNLHMNVGLHVRWKTVEHLFVAPEQSQSDESVHFGMVMPHPEGVH